MENYKQEMAELHPLLAKMRKEMPDVTSAFDKLAQAATKEGALNKKTKELIALALGIAAHCEGCIAFHTHTLVKLGTTREELLEMLGMAIYMGGGPSMIYASHALKAYEDFTAG